MVIVITGSSRGIGRFLAEAYLEQGHQVVGCSRSGSSLKTDRYRHYELDVSDEAAVRKMFSEVQKDFGGVDALINNAGRASMNHVLITPLSTVRSLIDVNFIGTFLCSREAAKLMSRRKSGRIVNFSTVAVPLNLAGEAAYAASKAAVVELTKVMAKELGSLGVTVNAVGPTPVDTDLIRNVPKPKIDELLRQQAIGRLGDFDDVRNVVDFFLRPESGFITGQVIYLGGVS